MQFHILLIYSFFKPEHTVRELLVNMFRKFGIVGIRVMAVIKFNDMKSAPVDVKMNVSLFKIRSNSFPDFYFGMELFHLTPCGIAYTLAVNTGGKQKVFQDRLFRTLS